MTGAVGDSASRVDARAKVTGAARYPGDRAPAEALTLKVVFTNRPHARLLSLDTSPAAAVPGVVAVFTAADVPINEYGLTLRDQPVMVGLDTTGRSEIPADISRWEADHLAVVVAETADAADEAAAAIETEWEDLAMVADIDQALAPGAPLVHTENGLDTNAYYGHRVRKGDMDAGWAEASAVVEGTYEFPHQEHAYLQPEAGIGYVDEEGRVTIEVAGQWAHEDRMQVAHALDLAEDRVRVIYPPIGGAFGGREDISVQIVLALAAFRLHQRGEHRPVATTWSREESIIGHHKRHRGRIRARWGADSSGRIVAVESEAWLDAGAYNYTSNKVLGNCHLSQAGPYEIPNAHIDSHTVYTHSIPAGAFRGFGGPQGSFAAEAQMAKLADALDMDPIEIRRINGLVEGSIGITQTPLPAGVTLPEVIDACERESDFAAPLTPIEFSPFASLPPEPGALVRGRGFACSYKNIGFSFGFPERCEAEIVLHGSSDDELPTSADLHHAGADVGQGAHTALLQMAAEATGLPLDAVGGDFSDTASSGDSGSVSASRLTWMAGNSILGAAEEADKAWRKGDRPAVGHFRYVPPPTEPLDPETGACVPNFSYGYLAQAVELTVDRDTGHIIIDRVVSTHDVGRAINPALVVGQIEGGVVQAHGYTLSENLQVSGGRLLNPRLSTYLIPGIGDVPTIIDSVVLELPDPIGPFGARGMAEMPMMAYAPAVIAALHDATGVWFDSFPLTPSRVLAGLR
ncbi:MAG: molybdopterin-dependent oxidoreductase [Actinomycetia bacterium]|nr:molybdopterin-dependent oxidoreductase [Actinomycetes bacterium]